MTKPAPDVGETPRTDALEHVPTPESWDSVAKFHIHKYRELARQLERELSQARAALGPVTDEELAHLRSAHFGDNVDFYLPILRMAFDDLLERRQGAGT